MTARTRFRAVGFHRRIEDLDGWPIRVTSYELPGRHVARVDNVSPGATVARAEAGSREEAERHAIEQARSRLNATRRFPID